MNSTTLLVILCVVVVCVGAFLSIPHSGKNKAAEKKVDPAEANKYALVAQDICGINSNFLWRRMC